MDEDGQLPLPLTAAQRTRLESARALVSALGSGRITKTVDDVTRQIAFNKIEGDGFKYPSLVEHSSAITDAAVRGDTDVARNELNHLRNFAQTLINKATAVNESAGTTNRVQYNNWIPSQNKWRVSAKGLNVDLKGDKSAAFGERIHTEAALASAVFTSMAEQFPELAAGIEPVTGVPAMAPALSAALANRQSATPAPTTTPTAPPAPTTPSWEEVSPTPPLPPALPWEEATPPTPPTTQVAPVTPVTPTANTAPKKGQSPKPGQKAISKLSVEEIMKRIQHIERNNPAPSLASNTVYQALQNELKARAAAVQKAEATEENVEIPASIKQLSDEELNDRLEKEMEKPGYQDSHMFKVLMQR